MINEKKHIKRFAVSRLHMQDGTILKNQVIETDGGSGKYLTSYPLEQELAFTEWRGGDYYLNGE